jgi:hypothetical protein
MDDHMNDRVEFLRARLDEHEARARAAKPGLWRWEIIDEGTPDEQPTLVSESAPTSERIVLDAFGEHTTGYLAVSPEDRAHIADNDPAFVLREVEAKRRIIRAYEGALRRQQEHPDDERNNGYILGIARAIQDLAGPYTTPPTCPRCGSNLAAGRLKGHERDEEVCPTCQPDHPFSVAVREYLAEQRQEGHQK